MVEKQSFELPPYFDSVLELHHGNTSGASLHYLSLYSFALGLESKEVLEFGAGGSTLAFLSALSKTDGRLTSVDSRPIHEIFTSPCPEIGPAWNFVQSDSRQFAPPSETLYDLVLHDGSHEQEIVSADLTNVIPRIRQYGLLLVHDTQHEKLGQQVSTGLMKAIGSTPVSVTTLPYGYGLTVVRIEGNEENGTVNLSWKKATSQFSSKPFAVVR